MKKLTALVLGAGAVAIAGYVFRAELEEKVLKLIETAEAFSEGHLVAPDLDDFEDAPRPE
jgi:hypothetical protein